MSAAAARRSGEIPAYLCVDVEPDARQVPRDGDARWTGYDAMTVRLEDLREQLADATSVPPRFAWFLRMDPQIAAAHGRADYAAAAFGERVERLTRAGDAFGVHVHPFRWSEPQGCWVHDFADSGWIAHCVESSFDAFVGAFGSAPLLHRFGAHFLSDELVAQLEGLGTRVDMSIEPGRPPTRLSLADTPMRGSLPDYAGVPRVPYHPSAGDYQRADNTNGRAIAMLPLSTTRARPDQPRWWRAARMVRRRFRPAALPLSPSQPWLSPTRYWDCVERHLDAMRRPYFAIAVRTDDPASDTMTRLRAALDLLPRHRLAQRLRFLDPSQLVVEP